jgi:hypothetical protein
VWGPPVSGSGRLARGAHMAVTQGVGGVRATAAAGPRTKWKAGAG